jgi:hypothetical protein
MVVSKLVVVLRKTRKKDRNKEGKRKRGNVE